MSLNSDGSSSSVTAYNLNGTELGTISVASVYAAGKKAASCSKDHYGATRTVGGVKQKLTWVSYV